MTSNPFRLGIISATGTARKRTLPALTRSSAVTVTAIHGRTQTTLDEVAAQFDVPRTATTVEALIAEDDLDGVMVCSPPFIHLEQASLALAAGLPVLLEKPAAVSLADVDGLIELETEAQTPVRVAHHLRHQQAWATISTWLAEGRLGTLVAADAQWSFNMNRAAASATWKLDPELNGASSLTDAGIHCLDAVLGLLGPATLAASRLRQEPGDRTYESSDLLLAQGPVTTHVRASRLFGPFHNDLTIVGSAGYIHAADFFTESSSAAVELHETDMDDVTIVKCTDRDAYRHEVEDFARIVQGGTPIYGETSLTDARQAMQLIEEAVASARPVSRPTEART